MSNIAIAPKVRPHYDVGFIVVYEVILCLTGGLWQNLLQSTLRKSPDSHRSGSDPYLRTARSPRTGLKEICRLFQEIITYIQCDDTGECQQQKHMTEKYWHGCREAQQQAQKTFGRWQTATCKPPESQPAVCANQISMQNMTNDVEKLDGIYQEPHGPSDPAYSYWRVEIPGKLLQGDWQSIILRMA